jgi:hypothetical protein
MIRARCVSYEIIFNGKKGHSYNSSASVGARNPPQRIIAEGQEKITAGGKEYDCYWQHVFNGKDGSSKEWICKDAPLDGVVKRIRYAADESVEVDLLSASGHAGE